MKILIYPDRKEEKRKYRLANRERLNAVHREYYAKNRLRISEETRIDRIKNPARYKARARRTYLKCRERNSRYAAQYRKTHKDHAREACKEWRKNNPEKLKKWKKNQIEKLSPCYVRKMIYGETNLKAVDIPESLVLLKTEHLKLRRAEREIRRNMVEKRAC